MALDLRLAATAALAALVTIPTAAFAAAEPTGIWLDDTGRGAVEIKTCGKGLCGHVVWVQDQNDKDGCGKQIIGDAVEIERGTWDGGWIYSPERKRRYDVELKPMGDDKLRVTGYAGSKLFSKQMVWKRAPADLRLCSTQSAALPAAKATEVAAAPAITPPAPTPAVRPPVSGSVPVPVPATRPQTGSSGEGGSGDADATPAPREPKQAEGRRGERKRLELGDLPIDKYFTRLPNGDCRLDTPWAKVTFPCEKK